MAGSAFLLEGAVMRVGVAVDAAGKLQAGVLGRLVRAGGQVAFGAGNFGVKAGKWVSGLGMIEPRDVLPCSGVVAGLAIFAELALVKVFVTGEAGLGEPEETSVEVLVLDQFLPLRLDAGRVVAVFTLDGRVLAFQRIACFVVIKFFLRRLPTY